MTFRASWLAHSVPPPARHALRTERAEHEAEQPASAAFGEHHPMHQPGRVESLSGAHGILQYQRLDAGDDQERRGHRERHYGRDEPEQRGAYLPRGARQGGLCTRQFLRLIMACGP